MNSADLVELHVELLAHYGDDMDELLADLTFAVRDSGSSEFGSPLPGLREVASLRPVRPLN